MDDLGTGIYPRRGLNYWGICLFPPLLPTFYSYISSRAQSPKACLLFITIPYHTIPRYNPFVLSQLLHSVALASARPVRRYEYVKGINYYYLLPLKSSSAVSNNKNLFLLFSEGKFSCHRVQRTLLSRSCREGGTPVIDNTWVDVLCRHKW